jgi:C1A family cysteine protease
MKIQRFGWVPDLPDHRDQTYAAPAQFLTALPTSKDLRAHCPPVYDQGQLGSCTANAIGGAIQFEQMKQGIKDFMPSRLFIYYNERALEGTIDSDSGAMIRDGMKVVAKQGACPEDPDWPYDIARFRDKPSHKAYQDAAKNQVLLYQRVNRSLNQMKGCLASGFPFVFGFTVYDSFESAQVAHTGHLNMPQPGEAVVGGHAVLAVGYDDQHHYFFVRNSWSDTWGMKGYFTIPYPYLLEPNLSDDFWTVRLMEAPKKAPKKAGKKKH